MAEKPQPPHKDFYQPGGEYKVEGLDHSIMLGDALEDGSISFKILVASDDFEGKCAYTAGEIAPGKQYALLGQHQVPVCMDILSHLVSGKVVIRTDTIIQKPKIEIRIQSPEQSIDSLLQKLVEKKERAATLYGLVEDFFYQIKLGDFLENYINDLSAQYEKHRDTLAELLQLEKDQYELMKQLTHNMIEKYQIDGGIDDKELDCVYWAGGDDEFTYGMPGYWKNVGVEGEENPLNLKIWGGVPQKVFFNVKSKGLPPLITAGSSKVTLFKTLGSGPPDLPAAFWRKMIQTQAWGGLLITSDDIPEKYKNLYEPFEIEIGSNTIEIERIGAHQSINGGYIPSKLSFWKRKELIFVESNPKITLGI